MWVCLRSTLLKILDFSVVFLIVDALEAPADVFILQGFFYL